LALKIQCPVIKNALLQTAFSAILPTGIELIKKEHNEIPFKNNYPQ